MAPQYMDLEEEASPAVNRTRVNHLGMTPDLRDVTNLVYNNARNMLERITTTVATTIENNTVRNIFQIYLFSYIVYLIQKNKSPISTSQCFYMKCQM